MRFMPRAPFNVHVIPFRKTGDRIEYAILKRPAGIWQGIGGGGEDNEFHLTAARRETFEESGIPQDAEFIRLDSVTPIPVVYFTGDFDWGDDVYVIPQYAFGVNAESHAIRLSSEHNEYRWLPYKKAYDLLHYHNTKHDLWELNQRLKGRGPRG
jgi:dihydroneopterin triphosphate diphosphatase